jgi:hypothetical protein
VAVVHSMTSRRPFPRGTFFGDGCASHDIRG